MIINQIISGENIKPELEVQTPLIEANSFENTTDCKFYVPKESLETYKTATNWVALAHRIFPEPDSNEQGE